MREVSVQAVREQRMCNLQKGGGDMRDRVRLMLGVAVAAAMTISAGRTHAEAPNAAPNPDRAVENWPKLPEGGGWGQATGVDIDRDGTRVGVYDRCGAKTCEARISRRSRSSTPPASW